MIVVDAAAVIDALTGVEGTHALRAFMASAELHAPALLDFEVVSALQGLTLRGDLSAARAQDAMTDFADLDVRRWQSSDAFRRRTFQLRHNVSAYDAAYVVVAEALDCPLLTRDGRLARAAGDLVRIELR